MKQIQEHSRSNVDIEYYHDRLPHISVIRYIPKPTHSTHFAAAAAPAICHTQLSIEDTFDQCRPPGETNVVAWIITHSAGDQGALRVVAPHRRKGLGTVVARARLAAEDKTGVRGHVWVMEGNVPSEALWRKMGWTKGWDARWHRLRPVRKDWMG